MSVPKKTKFRAIFKLEEAISEMYEVGFFEHEIREVIRVIIKKRNKVYSLTGKITKDTVLLRG